MPCTMDAECGTAMLCINGDCVQGTCRTRADCGPRVACVAYACGACSSDAECDGGACVSGLCVGTSVYGDGYDGDATVDATVNLHNASAVGRTDPDAAPYLVTSLETNSARLASVPSALAVGDEVLVVALRASAASLSVQPTDASNVGNWETRRIAAITEQTVTFHQPLQRSYTAGDGRLQVVGLFRIPHYRKLALQAGGSVAGRQFQSAGDTNAISPTVGGVLFIRVAEELLVATGAQLQMSNRGYRGGRGGAALDQDGRQGESIRGFGAVGRVGSPYNVHASTAALLGPNVGGGGAYVVGGGGGYGTAGGSAGPWLNGVTQLASGGGTYGDAMLNALLPGSGGGGLWRGNGCNGTNNGTNINGPGGRGGGVLAVFARAATIDGSLLANGERPARAAYGANGYAPGSGSGGAILLSVQDLVLNGTISAVGGAPSSPPACGDRSLISGGTGGHGRIRIDLDTINGVSPASDDGMAMLMMGIFPTPQINGPLE